LIMEYIIKDGALFVADAHANENRKEFLKLLKLIKNQKIKTPQLFLMGDIFDLLVGEIEHTILKNAEFIDLINKISQKIEVYYFEGNHDFNLKKLFPKALVFPLDSQPAIFKHKKTKLLLSHGDLNSGIVNTIYTIIIRNRTVLSLLNLINGAGGYFISKKILSNLAKKRICAKIKDFKTIVKQRLKYYDTDEIDMVLEGHFHQGAQYKFDKLLYKNFSSFACNGSFFIVQSHSKTIFLSKNLHDNAE